MAKQEKKARVRFQKSANGREGYAIEIFSEGEWGLETWFPLVARAGAEDTRETDFIHYTFLCKLSELQRYGYEIDLQF